MVNHIKKFDKQKVLRINRNKINYKFNKASKMFKKKGHSGPVLLFWSIFELSTL